MYGLNAQSLTPQIPDGCVLRVDFYGYADTSVVTLLQAQSQDAV